MAALERAGGVRMGPRVAVFTDFDGTVTTVDSLQRLLTVFTGDAWRRIEDEVEAGRLGDRSSLGMEFGLVRATLREALEVVDREIAVDPAFPGFAARMSELGVPLTILSGGFSSIIRRVLRRYGLGHLDVRANEARVDGGRWRVIPSRRRRLCDGCNHCKSASIVRAARAGMRTVFIGNGVTDRCPAGLADLVFAKGILAAHCRRAGIRHRPYRTFADVQRAMERELRRGPSGARKGTGSRPASRRPPGPVTLRRAAARASPPLRPAPGRGGARCASIRRSGPRSSSASGGRG